MDIVLIPGLWLDASSWDEVVPALQAGGHQTHPLTLPGMESKDTDRMGITLRDHIDAAVDVVDSLEGDVVLVGHSGGGTVAHGVVDRRPDRIARVIYVDAVPTGDGMPINDQLPAVGDEIPLPDWSIFDAETVRDLDDDARAAFRERSIPAPKRVSYDPQRLSDERRYDVPITVIACEYPSDMLKGWLAEEHPYTRELGRVREVDYVDLPTGHWPQFTRPAELAQAIAASV